MWRPMAARRRAHLYRTGILDTTTLPGLPGTATLRECVTATARFAVICQRRPTRYTLMWFAPPTGPPRWMTAAEVAAMFGGAA